MKKYTLIDSSDSKPVKDEDGDDVIFTATKDESIVRWLNQKCFEMNGCKEKGRYYIKKEQVN